MTKEMEYAVTLQMKRIGTGTFRWWKYASESPVSLEDIPKKIREIQAVYPHIATAIAWRVVVLPCKVEKLINSQDIAGGRE